MVECILVWAWQGLGWVFVRRIITPTGLLGHLDNDQFRLMLWVDLHCGYYRISGRSAEGRRDDWRGRASDWVLESRRYHRKVFALRQVGLVADDQ